MKYFLLLGGSLLLASAAHAQVGLRAGGNLAGYATRTDNSFRVSTGSQLGYQAGIFYRLPLGKHLSLVPEVQFSVERKHVTRSLASSNTDSPLDLSYTSRVDYVNVPLLLRFSLGRAYVELGAQGGYLVGGHEAGTLTSTSAAAGSATYSINRDVTYRYRRFDVGPTAGVGVVLPAGLGLSVRAYQGLVSLTHDSEASTGHLYRQTVQASLTYQLPGRP